MYLADGSITTIRHKITLSFLVHNKLHSIELKVFKKISSPVILGVDFLEKY